MSYAVEWLPGGVVLGMVLLLILPSFALIGLVIVALAVAVALLALLGAILALPYPLVRSRHRSADPDQPGRDRVSRSRSRRASHRDRLTSRTLIRVS